MRRCAEGLSAQTPHGLPPNLRDGLWTYSIPPCDPTSTDVATGSPPRGLQTRLPRNPSGTRARSTCRTRRQVPLEEQPGRGRRPAPVSTPTRPVLWLEFPQGGERIRGKANILGFRAAYPARLSFEMKRTTGLTVTARGAPDELSPARRR